MTAPVAELLVGASVFALLASLRLRPGPELRSREPAGAVAHTSRGRRKHRVDSADLAAWCDTLAGDARAGATLGGALRSHPAPVGSRLAVVGGRLRRGAPVPAALAGAAHSADERLVATVLAALARHGGDPAQPLDRVAATLRRRAADTAERRSQSAQARLSALVMTLLPGAVLVILLTTSTPTRDAVASPVGFALVVIGALLNLAGWWWMRRLVRGAERT